MKIVKKILIEKFRKMSKLEIPLNAHVVAIAGQNGTQKTSLLGMIAHPFSLKDKRDPMSKELDVYGCRFGSAIQDRFKFSGSYDKAGEHIRHKFHHHGAVCNQLPAAAHGISASVRD